MNHRYQPYPAWFKEGDSFLNQLAEDTHDFQVNELVRCWFCNSTRFAWWGPTIRCARSCGTYYVLLPLDSGVASRRTCCVPDKAKGRACGETTWQLRPTKIRCPRCKTVSPFPFGSRLKGMFALLEPEVRDELRKAGFLKPEGGPTFKLQKITEPWKPRVDLPREEYINRLRKYRNWEISKAESGRDVNLDYRRLRDEDW